MQKIDKIGRWVSNYCETFIKDILHSQDQMLIGCYEINIDVFHGLAPKLLFITQKDLFIFTSGDVYKTPIEDVTFNFVDNNPNDDSQAGSNSIYIQCIDKEGEYRFNVDQVRGEAEMIAVPETRKLYQLLTSLRDNRNVNNIVEDLKDYDYRTLTEMSRKAGPIALTIIAIIGLIVFLIIYFGNK